MTPHLQRIQNYAARVILHLRMSSSITTHLKSLHWIPVIVRSTYKIACLCYHCHSSTAPSYVADMLHIKPSHTRNTRSSSSTMPLLNRPAHGKATLGDRSFYIASSFVWNSIPNNVRCAPISYQLVNHDCLPILMLLYIMLYIVLAYLMLFAALCNAVCLYNAFFSIDFCNHFCYALSWFIDT